MLSRFCRSSVCFVSIIVFSLWDNLFTEKVPSKQFSNTVDVHCLSIRSYDRKEDRPNNTASDFLIFGRQKQDYQNNAQRFFIIIYY